MAQPFLFYWTGQDDDELIKRTVDAVNWNALLDITRKLSGDTNCLFEGNINAGGRHIVRRIVVPSKRIRWIARLPIVSSSYSNSNDNWWTEERWFIMQSEVATMKHIALHTDIPVPEVFAHDTLSDVNPVGLPYVLMHCIEGNTIFDLGGLGKLTLDQNRSLHQSIAFLQYQMFQASISQIGCLTFDSGNNIVIGHLPVAFGSQGPFTRAADYFLSWCDQDPEFKNLPRLNNPLLKSATQSFPKCLKLAIQKVRNDKTCRYPIVHPDFGLHNILLNNDFEIVGVIDWEHAHSAPAGVFAARTNIFARFDATNMSLKWDNDGAIYMTGFERIKNPDPAKRLSMALTDPLAILGFCMQLYEEGRAIPFDEVLNRLERELK